MSSSDRRAFLILASAAGLAACGFTPALAPDGAPAALRGRVLADTPKDTLSYQFVARIETRLGRPEAPLYDLGYKIRTQQYGVGITQENEVVRYDLRGWIDWTLTDRATGKKLTGGRVETFTAYFTSGTTVATLAAEQDANRRLIEALADQIVTRLVAGAGDLP